MTSSPPTRTRHPRNSGPSHATDARAPASRRTVLADLSRMGLVALAPCALGACGQAKPPLAQAPHVAYTLLDGQTASSHSWPGQVVLVNFWATSCAVCVAEMPSWVALHRRHASRGLRTVAVAMAYDPPARVAAYAERHRLPFDVVIDNLGQVAKAFGDVRATPEAWLMGRDGRVLWRHQGAVDLSALEPLLTQALGAPSTPGPRA